MTEAQVKQDHAEDLMFFVLEVFYKNSPIKNSSVLEYFNNNSLYPLFSQTDIVNAILSHSKSKLILWKTEEGNRPDKTYEITQNGKAVYEKVLASRDRHHEESELQFKKIKFDVKNSERVYRTYGTTRAIMWITFIMTIILSLLKLAETLHIWPYHK